MKKSPLHIIPFGGLGEIGMNMMAYEYAGKFLIVDCGITFPDHSTPGVDVIIPDTTFLEEHREQIVGIVFTHGHEDHIGGVAHLWPKLQAPLYAAGMTYELITGKLSEYHLLEKAKLTKVRFKEKIQIGPFSVRLIPVTHSIPDSAALAIKTPLGVIIHTGDFKFDHTSVSRTTDLYNLSKYGESGVLALLSDSTNVHKPGHSPSERDVYPTLKKQIEQAQGLVIATTFSSNVDRLKQLIEISRNAGRKVLLNGRSIINNIQIAESLNYCDFPSDTWITLKEFNQFPRHKVTVISTGSQGEHRSSLMRIASGEHKEIKIEPGDTILFSSKFIPGNERTIWNLINAFSQQGAHVLHEKNCANIHVSGHAFKDDLTWMLSLIKPRFFIPIHGEPYHLQQHLALAHEMGVKEKNSLIAHNGDRITLTEKEISITGKEESGRIFLDGLHYKKVDNIVLHDRILMGNYGMITVVLIVDKESGKPIHRPALLSRGIVFEDENQELLEKAKDAVEQALALGPEGMDFAKNEEAGLAELAIRGLRRFFKKNLGRRPVVLPLIIEI
ncbi:ribonuclease J [Magnetococcales bacterium HHB-1]